MISTSSGSAIGKFSSFSGTTPQHLQCTTGIGAPQYLWREIPQSLSLWFVIILPRPSFSNFSIIKLLASSELRPFISSEFIATPYSEYALEPSLSPSSGFTTGFIGRLNLLANSKSLWSCAGTAMIAPLP